MLIGILILMVACQQNQKLAIMSITPHAYIEITAIFYWINTLRKTCLKHSKIKLETYNFKEYLNSVKNHKNILKLIKHDLSAFLKTTNASVKSLWNEQTKKKLLITVSLFIFSAFIETYITPTLIGL